jgi:copper(I)-binding protein
MGKLVLLRATILGLSALLFVACEKEQAAVEESSLSITDLVVRETPPGKQVTAAYMRIKNDSDQNWVLNYVHSPLSDRIEVHRHIYEDGLMKMREVKHLSIQPSSSLDFKPGGYHLMIFDLYDPAVAGNEVTFTFEFEGQEPIVVKGQVKRM